MALLSARSLTGLTVIGSSDMADLFGVTRHTLTMRMRRGHPDVPPEPDARLDGCLIWYVTEELVDSLAAKGVDTNGIGGT